MKRTTAIIAVAVVAIFGSAALASPLPPGSSLDKPGTSPALPGPNYYTIGLPSYFLPVNLVTSLTAPIVPSAGNITGTVISTVYMNPSNSQLTFEYKFTNTGADELIRAAFDLSHWAGVTITDAGADGSGSSYAGTVLPTWTNGDPIFIGRDATAYPYIQWRADSKGTSLVGPSSGLSSNIWFSTNATAYQVGYTGLSDGGAISSANVLGPNVPEPITMVTLLLGMGGMAVRRRRRMAAK